MHAEEEEQILFPAFTEKGGEEAEEMVIYGTEEHTVVSGLSQPVVVGVIKNITHPRFWDELCFVSQYYFYLTQPFVIREPLSHISGDRGLP